MNYSQDQLTGWFDAEKQKPWEPGVYVVFSTRHQEEALSYWDGEKFCYAWVDCGEGIFANIERAIRDKDDDRGVFELSIDKWRGLSQNPNPKPKRSGNKRKVMYVVMFDKHPVAAFETKQQYKDYIKRGNIWWTSIEKIRFRTPEHN